VGVTDDVDDLVPVLLEVGEIVFELVCVNVGLLVDDPVIVTDGVGDGGASA